MELILTHLNTDFDALASALAAARLYPQAKILFPGSHERNVRDFIRRYPNVIPALGSRDLTKEKITRLILVDVSAPERLGDFKSLLQVPQVEIIRYDHHPRLKDKIPAHKEVLKALGANTTILMEELRKNRISVAPFEATVYALGIYEETGNLTYTSTTPRDLQAAAYLLRCGADLSLVSDFIQRRLSSEQQELFNDLIKSRETLTINGVDISLALAEREKYIEDLAVLTNKLRDIENLPALFTLCRMGNRTHLVARSRGEAVDVGEIIQKLGGGGHATAAAATIKETNLKKLRQRLLQIIKAGVKPAQSISAIMSSPVISISSGIPVSEARQVMMRYGHSGLPVVDQAALVGIITLHDLDKALHHGLEKAPVRNYMSTRIVTVRLQDTVALIQRHMLENHISYIPVLDQGRLAGIVTRTDILRFLLERRRLSSPRFHPEDCPEIQSGRDELRSLMRERLPAGILNLLHTAGEAADRMGIKAYVVGGFVRDILLKRDNWDVDIVVEGNGMEYARQLAGCLGGEVKTHQRFQTAGIRLPGHLKLDIATARTEFYIRPAALPQVEAAGIKYDLLRRDFSINAMAIQINSADFGRFRDFFGGRQDLRDGLIRVLYSMSFVDDPTRIFRAVRFEQRYNFHLESDTERYLHNAMQLDLMGRVSLPRIFDELMLILDENQPYQALLRLGEFNVLAWINTSSQDLRRAAGLFESVWEVLAFAVLFLEEEIDPKLMYLMAMLDHLSLVQTAAMAKGFQFSRRVTEILLQQKSRGDRERRRIESGKEIRASIVAEQLVRLPTEVLLFEMAKYGKKAAARRIRDYLTRWRKVRPLLAGRDLAKLGYAPGPRYEKILKSLLAARLDNKVVSRQDEINFVRRGFKKDG